MERVKESSRCQRGNTKGQYHVGSHEDFSVYSECDGEPVPDFEWHDLTFLNRISLAAMLERKGGRRERLVLRLLH